MKLWKTDAAACIVAVVCLLAGTIWAQESSADRAARRRKAMEERAMRELAEADPVMGDWSGAWELDDGGDYGTCVAQVVVLGEGRYRINLMEQFDTRMPAIASLEGTARDGAVVFTGPGNYDGRALRLEVKIADGGLKGTFDATEATGKIEMERVVRLSPTLGARAPEDAVVLFNGRDMSQWRHPGKPDGQDGCQWTPVGRAMEVKPGSGSIISRPVFGDVRLHVEFRTPFMPQARGQGRGNSGVYLQGRYEVQVLDSYGLEGADNECGGLYQVAKPLVNMCAPPTQWQTYDITFRAPVFDSQGNRKEPARMTVLHNGVRIHDNIALPGATTAALGGDPRQLAGVYLQDHGNKVQFRNIWAVELKD